MVDDVSMETVEAEQWWEKVLVAMAEQPGCVTLETAPNKSLMETGIRLHWHLQVLSFNKLHIQHVFLIIQCKLITLDLQLPTRLSEIIYKCSMNALVFIAFATEKSIEAQLKNDKNQG